jgi:hypothetical protein
MTHAIVFTGALIGFVLLMVAMPRHQQDWLGRRLPPHLGRVLRVAGLVALTLAFLTAGLRLGWGYGAVSWFGWLTVAAAVIVTVDVQRARILRLMRQG